MYLYPKYNAVFMKSVAILLAGLGCISGVQCFGGEAPRGNLLEAHSCELYAGGCLVSSQATLEGRYLVRAWQFTGGTAGNTDLAGLGVALLQASPDNLASSSAVAGRGVVYLPASATAAQRGALLSWIKSTQPGLDVVETRPVPLRFERSKEGEEFSAGNYVSVRTRPMQACDTGTCGESLWYEPRTPSTVFTVAVNQGSKVDEPALALRWEDAGTRSVFLGRFGDPLKVGNLYVGSGELCGVTGSLF